MLIPQELESLVERIAARRTPVFSAYLNVSPADPENRGKAYVLRLKDALKETKAPRDLAERVLRRIEAEQPRGRTLALFAAPDGGTEAVWLQTRLPEEARWGEPHVAPLVMAMEEHEPSGVVLLDARRVRFFVTVLGQIEEELGAANVFDTAGWREFTISPSSVNPGGGTAKDVFEQRVEAWTHRFYKEVAEELRHLVMRLDVRRLILAGPGERVAAFRQTLSADLQKLVAATVHLPVDASEGEVLERISQAEERLERERERELLAEAAERGVRGLKTTLEALQEGRVYRLLAPWPPEGEVSWCDACPAASLPGPDGCRYCGGPTRPRALADALLDLAATRGARLEFVLEENADTLRRDYGGLAGLIRF